jgi:molecular chaperone GrpE
MNGDDVKTTAEERSGTAPPEAAEAEKWRQQAETYLDQYRRSVADFSNYRKRQERDQQQQAQRLTIDALKPLLPIVDDLQRAVRNVPAEIAGNAWVEGVALIERKMMALLAGFQAVPIVALGQPFDPNYHSALMQSESEQYPAGVVMEELQTGYHVGDQVLRPTLVKISSGPGPRA